MTLAQVSLLFDADRRYHEPRKGRGSDAPEPGTAMDLAMFATMRTA